MKTRIITAFLIIACVIPPLVFGGVLLYALLSFIIVAGGLELMALREQKDETWPLLIKPLAIACVFALTFIKKDALERQIPLAEAQRFHFLFLLNAFMRKMDFYVSPI